MKILICDSVQVERERCYEMVIQLARRHGIHVDIKMYDRGDPMLFAFHNPEFHADIIYMDMELEGVSGIEVAKNLRKRAYMNEIIFVTRTRKYLLDGYDVNAFHYIIKNETSKPDFERIFINAVEAVKQKQEKVGLFTGASKNQRIPLHSIRYFSVDKKTITIHYGIDETFQIFVGMGKLEKEFEMHGFIRAQRSYLVSLYHIIDINYKEITMSDGTVITIRRGTYMEIRKALEDYMGEVPLAPMISISNNNFTRRMA